jgi:hypothetical protein
MKIKMEVSKNKIIIRLIQQVYNYADEIIYLKDKIKQLEIDLENEKDLSNWV